MGSQKEFYLGRKPTLFFVCPLHLWGRRIGGLLPRCFEMVVNLHPNSVLSHCRLRLPATISPRPVSILKVAPRSVLESSQLRGQRRTKRLHVPTYCHGSSKLDAAMVPRTLSKWLLVCHLNISQPALMSVLEISHQSTFTFLHTVYNPT